MKQKNQKKTYETVLFLGKPLFSNSVDSLLKNITEKVIVTKKVLKIFTPNPEQFVLANENPEFSRTLSQADILIPDGIGVVAFSKLIGKLTNQPMIKERIAGVDLVQRLLKLASEKSWKVLLIGGQDYDQRLHQVFIPGLTQEQKLSLLWKTGYKNIAKPTAQEEDAVVRTIKQEQPDLVFVAFGAPWQENWVINHEDLLTANQVKLAMVVGGTFDMLLGKLHRAPLVIRGIGLEWLFRLIQEPQRWQRQLKLAKFIVLGGKELNRALTKK